MKKFIFGFIAGALVFGTIPVFADSVKSLIGTKVTGVYVVEKSGMKIADGAVINGSAYVPVRAIANATGTNLTVEGKKIKLGGVPMEDEWHSREGKIREELDNAKFKLKLLEEALPAYEKSLKRAQDILNNESEYDPAANDRFVITQRILDEKTAEINTLKQRIADLEAEIARIHAEIGASK